MCIFLGLYLYPGLIILLLSGWRAVTGGRRGAGLGRLGCCGCARCSTASELNREKNVITSCDFFEQKWW